MLYFLFTENKAPGIGVIQDTPVFLRNFTSRNGIEIKTIGGTMVAYGNKFLVDPYEGPAVKNFAAQTAASLATRCSK